MYENYFSNEKEFINEYNVVDLSNGSVKKVSDGISMSDIINIDPDHCKVYDVSDLMSLYIEDAKIEVKDNYNGIHIYIDGTRFLISFCGESIDCNNKIVMRGIKDNLIVRYACVISGYLFVVCNTDFGYNGQCAFIFDISSKKLLHIESNIKDSKSLVVDEMIASKIRLLLE